MSQFGPSRARRSWLGRRGGHKARNRHSAAPSSMLRQDDPRARYRRRVAAIGLLFDHSSQNFTDRSRILSALISHPRDCAPCRLAALQDFSMFVAGVTAAPLPAMRLRSLTSFSISAAGIGCFQALRNHAMQGDIHATTDFAAQTRPSGALRARDVPATRCTLRHVDAASRDYV